MELNADFSQRAAMHGATMDWISSPTPGVDRRMFDRMGEEVARATSIVRYAPDSLFPAHIHSGGEEYFVLEGVFQDDAGDFPRGTYVRNPPQSRHTPGSEPGCVIFVKLWQFDPQDRTQVRVNSQDVVPVQSDERLGVELLPLYRDERENVRLERWAANTSIELDAPGGLEILVLEGDFSEGGETFSYQSWLRLPAGARFSAQASHDGCKVWVKSGHLSQPQRAPSAG